MKARHFCLAFLVKEMEEPKIIVWEDDPNVPKEERFIPNNPLERPKIKYAKPIIAVTVYVLQLVGLFLIPCDRVWLRILIIVAYSLIYFAFIAKKTVIWLVRLYQSKAPDEVRLRCAMEPSCSVYMILAVEKYGVVRGVYKGILRLFRCGNVTGVDYP